MSFDHTVHFQKQAEWCDRLGSPFTAALLRCAVEDFDAIAPLLSIKADWRDGDASALRFAGALNAAVLSGRAPELAALYPPSVAEWDIEAVWREVLALTARDDEWLRDFLRHPPQTNETRRAIALLPAFLELARFGPLHLLELGASAGLNLNWPFFHYRAESWSWGSDKPTAPHLSTDWSGPAPDTNAQVEVATQAACDAHPLTCDSPTNRLRLKSYIWPDQADRIDRFERAADLAIARGVSVDQSDAGDWLARKLAGEAPAGVTVIYHSIVWQYLSDASRAVAEQAITQAATQATPNRPIAHVQFEQAKLLGLNEEGFAVHLRLWPENGRSRVIARADPHGRWVEML